MVTTLTSIFSVLLVALGLYDTNDQNRKQQDLAERGQVTERFTKAIDQLGSDKLDVRLGGIYALERLMRDSPSDRSNIVEVISAFIREHSPQTYPSPRPAPAPSSTPVSDPSTSHLVPPATDVQAALAVLKRRPPTERFQVIDLHGAYMTDADLGGIDLSNADLSRADLTSVNLTRANLTGADLRGARLDDATIDGAYLKDANLWGANLSSASIGGANLSGAQMSAADLAGVDLSDALGLSSEQFRCSETDRWTRAPAGVTLPAPGEVVTADPFWVRPGCIQLEVPPS